MATANCALTKLNAEKSLRKSRTKTGLQTKIKRTSKKSFRIFLETVCETCQAYKIEWRSKHITDFTTL